jgi:alkyl sulfatase BDS1-like metallo-beta-lactamase superfamily hydrolase
MRQFFSSKFAACFIFSTVAIVGLAAEVKHPYMGGEVELVTAPNGAVINSYTPSRLEIVHPSTPQVIEVADGIWQLAGMSISWPLVIEGEDGLIVYDTGDNLEEGRHFAQEIEKLSDKPVKAIIYSHAHYTKGASAIAGGNKDVMVIGHPMLNANITGGGGLGTYFPEITPVQMARAMEQFNNFTPRSGPDAPVAGIIEFKEGGHLPVTRVVEDGEEFTVAGIRMQFFTRYHSDTDDCLTVWLPERKIVLNNLFWPNMPNFYTPRGALYRDPFNWIEGLKMIRRLEPELLLNTHTFPVKGKAKIREHLNLFSDGIAFIVDQTLRGILLGLGPDELRTFVELPPHLEAFPFLTESYGELQWYPPYFFNRALGWWDGDAATLYRLPPDDEAARLVALMGGAGKVRSAADASLAEQEYAWAAQLANYLLRLDPDDQGARQIKAKALREMGHRARGSIMRSFALSQALELEGKVDIPGVIPPALEQIAASPPARYLSRYRVRIDPARSADIDRMVRFVFTDAGDKALALHLRRGVVEFVEEPDQYPREADYTVSLDRRTWGSIFLGQGDVAALIDQDTVAVEGDRAGVVEFFSLFDDFQP